MPPFTIIDIEEIVESQAILNYANDMIKKVMDDWVTFMDQLQCDHKFPDEFSIENSKCKEEVAAKEIHFLRPINYFLFDPTWSMVREFLQYNSTALYMERLLVFDDWSEYNPIINLTSLDLWKLPL